MVQGSANQPANDLHIDSFIQVQDFLTNGQSNHFSSTTGANVVVPPQIGVSLKESSTERLPLIKVGRHSMDKRGLSSAAYVMKGGDLQGVLDRKELLRKEYNRVIETRLPNIYTMMS